jgi:hypothetical protein
MGLVCLLFALVLRRVILKTFDSCLGRVSEAPRSRPTLQLALAEVVAMR